jgi:hypothetical protein
MSIEGYNLRNQIHHAQRTAELSVGIAREAGAELLGVEALLDTPQATGECRERLIERRERCKDRQIRHEESAAVWSAAARKLRENNTDRPAIALAAADGTPHAQAQAQEIEAERNEALGLAVAS